MKNFSRGKYIPRVPRKSRGSTFGSVKAFFNCYRWRIFDAWTEDFQGHIIQWRAESNLTPVVWPHCVHQENLIAKSLKMAGVTEVII